MGSLWLRSAEKTAKKIESLRDFMRSKTNDELKDISIKLKERAMSGEKPEKLLVESFALVREVSRRTIGLEPFKVQLIGGIAIHEGKMTEMKTGEGKTLVAVLPAYLNALYGNGVHVVTVNDYLAKRDSEWMGQIYSFLGLTVGCVLQSDTTGQRKGAYAKDITYVTNTQLGFDYLRDNMAQSSGMVVQRGLNFAIIDEADSILIDEARTPLIISGNGEDVSKLCNACDILAKKMEKGTGEFDKLEAFLGERQEETGDFIVYEKDKIIALTEQGVKKIENFFRIEHYGDDSNMQLHHAMDLALRANYIMEKDKDYIVRDGEVLIVDEFTGRIMEGRQYSDGLHQAIEAKEHVEVKQITQTIATTTYQCFFNKYKKKAGMTGTAYTEKKEFRQTYNMKTVVIPTNEPLIRIDRPDVVYMTHRGKYLGVINEIKKTHETGQPILIGTASVEDSEELSGLLKEAGITHQVLNAKQDKKEADIIAKAGIHGTVTIATNMAGRGTDIILDEESKKAGGLKVIGTERHESRRIDNQLRGRSGRQGDPGESVFFVSMEDRIVRLFAPKRMLNAIEKLDTSGDAPLEGDVLGKTIRRAQKTVEEDYYGVRKNLLDYDKVNDAQREMIYEERRMLLAGEDCSNDMKSIMNAFLKRTLKKSNNTDELIKMIKDVIPLSEGQEKAIKSSANKYTKLKEVASLQYEERKEKVKDLFPVLEQLSLLRAIDAGWMEQLIALDYLKQDVSYEGFAQNDPKTVYANGAFELYDKMKDLIQKQAVYSLFHFTVVPRKTQEAVAS